MAKAKKILGTDRKEQSIEEGCEDRKILLLREPFSVSIWSGSPFALVSRFDDEAGRMKEDYESNYYRPSVTFGRSLRRGCGKNG